MAALPSPTQIAGNLYTIYDDYFKKLEKQGRVSAIEAAKFLKKSGLPDSVLSKIWDLSDTNAQGSLTKAGFFTALKLVAIAQSGHEIINTQILMEFPPITPNFGTSNSAQESNVISSVPSSVYDWSMKPEEKAKYNQLFESLQPLNGVIPGNKVKGHLIESKLPVSTLGKIWDLADMDKDGSLDKHEFAVAMHLVYKALEKYTIPNSLPIELLAPTIGGENNTPPEAQEISVPNGALAPWVVTPLEKAKFDQLFEMADADKDGYVSGAEIKCIFLQSKLQQPTLAKIWGLCDLHQTGKLNSDQFALAMWIISQALRGIDPPAALTPEMVPPSFRLPLTQEPVVSPYLSPELNQICQDIEELSNEKQCLEREIMHKETEIMIKTSEANSLQGELVTLAATLKQLENQKGEAHRRLNDLKDQILKYENESMHLRQNIEVELAQVDKLRKDAEEQALIVKSQEEELLSKRKELEDLKSLESKLVNTSDELSNKLAAQRNSLQDSTLDIATIKTSVDQIQELQNKLKDAITTISECLENAHLAPCPQQYLGIEPLFRDPSFSEFFVTEDVLSSPTTANETTNANSNNSRLNACEKELFFASNYLSSGKSPESDFGGNDPFASLLGESDPFGPCDGNRQSAVVDEDFTSDPFGCEPFEVTAPALPPKNKQPPPRPAPPRPAPPAPIQPPPNTTDAFADFANFNSNVCKFNSSPTTFINNRNTNDSIGTKSASTSNQHQFNRNPTANQIQPNWDFTEDPFKDYRYEFAYNFSDNPFESESTLGVDVETGSDCNANPDDLLNSRSNLNKGGSDTNYQGS